MVSVVMRGVWILLQFAIVFSAVSEKLNSANSSIFADSNSVESGEVATFTCHLANNETMNVSWTHDSKPVDHFSPRISIITNHTSSQGVTLYWTQLRVFNVSKKDQGIYTCLFIGDSDTFSGSTVLAVRGAIHSLVGGYCFTDKHCSENATRCNKTNNKCECLPDFPVYLKDERACFKAELLNAQCYHSKQCELGTQHAVCLHHSCQCGKEFALAKNTCVPVLHLKDVCLTEGICVDPETECGPAGRCVCKEGWTEKDEACVLYGLKFTTWLSWVGIVLTSAALVLLVVKLGMFLCKRRNPHYLLPENLTPAETQDPEEDREVF